MLINFIEKEITLILEIILTHLAARLITRHIHIKKR